MNALKKLLFVFILGLGMIFWGGSCTSTKKNQKEKATQEKTTQEKTTHQEKRLKDAGTREQIAEKHLSPEKHNLQEKKIIKDSNTGGTFSLESSAFKEGEAIPRQYGCGKDRNFKKPSPALKWQNVPKGTKSFVLLLDDPDAGGFLHWLVIDIPASTSELAEGASGHSMPQGAKEFLNDFGSKGYGGPCPPSGVHHYRFRLYALPDAQTTAFQSGQVTSNQIHTALKKKALGIAQLQGTFTPAK